jgi:cytoskeleton protein RodZ
VGTFGEKFRKERERRGFSLDDVANVTKIGSRMLKAIEDEHFDLLPGGVFNKGFIRAYAKHLGLNDEEAVNDYLEALQQAQVEAQGVRETQPPPGTRTVAEQKLPGAPAKTQVVELPDLHMPRAEDVRPARLDPARRGAGDIPWRVPAIVFAMIVAGLVFWYYRSRGEGSTAARVSAAQTTADQAPPANAASAAKTPVAGQLTSEPAAAPARSAGQAAMPGASSPNQASPQSSARPGAALADSSADNSESAEEDNRPRSPSRPAALTLVIRAAENSWISVTADGQTVSQETLIAPAHTSVRANHEIVVRAGNAAGVSFLLNGKEIAAQGGQAEVRTFVFDGTGMHVTPTAPTPDPVR